MDFLDIFGLQVLLEDKTTAGVQSVQRSLNQLGVTVNDVEQSVYGSFQRMESIMHSGFQIGMWGQRMTQIGQSITNMYTGISKKVLQVGASFEEQRIKLRSLYGDAKKAEDVFQYAVKQALESPFSVQEYVSAVSGLKVSGIDPLKQYMNEKTGQMQDMITFAGDLAGAYGKNMQDAFFSMKEAIAGNDFRSLKHRFDGLSKSVIEASTGMKLSIGGAQKDIDQRAEVFAKFIGMKYGGMMKNLGGSIKGLYSRLKENIEILFMEIGDAGYLDFMKKELMTIIQFLEGGQPKIKQFAKVISDTLISLTKPIVKLVQLATVLIDKFIDFSIAHPMLAKIVATVTMLTGGFLILSGILVTISGGFITMVASLATLALNMRMTHGSVKLSAMLIQGFGKVVATTTLAMLKWGLISAVFATAWKYNIGGIRDTVKDLGINIKGAFKQFNEMTKVKDNDIFGAMVYGMKNSGKAVDDLTVKLLQGYYLLYGMFDYLADGLVSEDTVHRLNALGLLPLLETFIEIETAIRSIAVGVATYLVNAWNTVKEPVLWVHDKIQSILKLVAEFFGLDFKSSSEINGEAFFGGKAINQDWVKVGTVIGSFVGMGIVSAVTKRILGIFKTIKSVNNMFKNAFATKNLGDDLADGKILATNPLTRAGRKDIRDGKKTSKDLTWRTMYATRLGNTYKKASDVMAKANDKTTRVFGKVGSTHKKLLAQQAKSTDHLKKQVVHAKDLAKKLKAMPLKELMKFPFNAFMAYDLMGRVKKLSTHTGRLSSIAGKILRGDKPDTKIAKGGLSERGLWEMFRKNNPRTAGTVDKIGSTRRMINEKIVTTKEKITNVKDKVVGKPATVGAKGTGITGMKEFGEKIGSNVMSFIIGQLSASVMAKGISSMLGRAGLLVVSGIATISSLGAIALAVVGVLIGVFKGNETSQKIYQAGIDWVEWYIAGVYVAFTTKLDLKRFIYNTVKGWLADVPTALDEAEKVYDQFLDDVTKSLLDLAGIVGGRLGELVGIFVQFAKDVFKDPRKAFETFKADMVQWGLDIQADFTAWKDELVGKFVTFGEDLMKAVRDLKKGMKELFSKKGWSNLASPFTSFIDDIGKKIEKLIGWVDKAKQKANEVNEGVSTGRPAKKAPKPSKKYKGMSYGQRSALQGMSTGGEIRSAGMFRLHEGEAVVRSTAVSNLESSIRRLQTMASSYSTGRQHTTDNSSSSVVYKDEIHLDNVNFNLPNVQDTDDFMEFVKDPRFIQEVAKAFANAKRTEQTKRGRRHEPDYGIAGV